MTGRPGRVATTLALLSFVLLGGACAGDDDRDETASVTGTYECGIEGQPATELWELSEDQRLAVTVKESGDQPEEGRWHIEGGQVIIDFAGASNDPFDMNGDTLVFAGPESPEGTWVCTRTT